jgi:hypothetical protein
MFGLEITQSGMDSQHASIVTAVRCLFCMRLGRDSIEFVDGRKRQRTQNVKYFSPPFRKGQLHRPHQVAAPGGV